MDIQSKAFQGMEKSELGSDFLDYGLAMHMHPSLLHQSHDRFV